MAQITRNAVFLIVGLVMLLALPVGAQDDPVQLRILWYNDNNESVVLRDLLDEFEAAHPDISVELDLTTGAEHLPLLREQLDSDNAPDLALTTVPGEFRGELLDLRDLVEDPAYWEANFNDAFLAAMRENPESDAIHGFPSGLTISAPFINRTLWEEAGVPVPSDDDGEATWDEWVTAALQVQAALSTEQTPIYALLMDFSGHRFWGPSLSMCASYVDPNDPESEVVIDTEGFRQAAAMLKSWHEEAIFPPEVWAEDTADRVNAAEFFVDGQAAFYFSGNWQLARFDSEITDFEWDVVPNPVGACGQTGMIGGSSFVAFASTEHPEEVGLLMDFLAAEENLRRYYEQNDLLPGHLGMVTGDNPLEYTGLVEELKQFQTEVERLDSEAYALQYRLDSSQIHVAIREALVLLVNFDLSIDETVFCAEYFLEGGDDCMSELRRSAL